MAKRQFHWSTVNDCVMHETDEPGNTLVNYTHEPGAYGPLISENRGGTEYYHHYDALGSTTMLTDASGNVTDTFQYDAWGVSVARTGTTPTPYTWCGRWGYQDDTATIGGYYVRARDYKPTVARWASVDPSLFERQRSQYTFVENQPTLLNDASGLQAQVEWTIPFPITISKDIYALDIHLNELKCKLDQGCALDACDKPEDYCRFYFVVLVARSYVWIKMEDEDHGTCTGDIDRSNGPSFIEVSRKEKPNNVCQIRQADFDPGTGRFTMPAACRGWLDAPTANNSQFTFTGTIMYVKYDFGLDIYCSCDKAKRVPAPTVWRIKGGHGDATNGLPKS